MLSIVQIDLLLISPSVLGALKQGIAIALKCGATKAQFDSTVRRVFRAGDDSISELYFY